MVIGHIFTVYVISHLKAKNVNNVKYMVLWGVKTRVSVYQVGRAKNAI